MECVSFPLLLHFVYLKPQNHHLLQALEPTNSQTLLGIPLWSLSQGPPTAVVILLHLLHLRLRALGSLQAILLLLCPSSTALKQSPNSHPAEFWINRVLLLYALKIFIWIKLSFPNFPLLILLFFQKSGSLWLLNVFCKNYFFLPNILIPHWSEPWWMPEVLSQISWCRNETCMLELLFFILLSYMFRVGDREPVWLRTALSELLKSVDRHSLQVRIHKMLPFVFSVFSMFRTGFS